MTSGGTTRAAIAPSIGSSVAFTKLGFGMLSCTTSAASGVAVAITASDLSIGIVIRVSVDEEETGRNWRPDGVHTSMRLIAKLLR